MRPGMACMKSRVKKPCAMEIMPKNRPTDASENATGKPIIKNTTSPANIRGGIHSKGIIALASRNGLQGRGCHSPATRRRA